ncbi:hypothetical protein DOY81_008031 [Sarcophaga bullata]|nr:hypothetical protein DOY81_008031 [Sarcophaga bullata]
MPPEDRFQTKSVNPQKILHHSIVTKEILYHFQVPFTNFRNMVQFSIHPTPASWHTQSVVKNEILISSALKMCT